MKLLIFSDAHGRLEPMRSSIRLHEKDTDAILFLGDGAAEVLTLRAEFPSFPFHAVLGNCDSFSYVQFGIRQEQLLTFGDKTLFLCHGDRFGVGGGHGALAAYARHRGADIALFGHCHIVCDEYHPAEEDSPDSKPLWIFSPGSISLPRDGQPSYGILDISEKGILFSAARTKYNPGGAY